MAPASRRPCRSRRCQKMPRPKLSISLPSLYPVDCERSLKNLRDATRCDFEVVLVSPFVPPEVDGIKVIWIEEPEGTGTGCNAGHARAFERMTGEYLMPWVDDHYVLDGWDAVALPSFEAREKAFQTEHPGKPFVLGLRHIFPHHCGSTFGIYYPYFPFSRRVTYEKIGWYDPSFLKGFADSDLAMRVWDAGGRCEWADRGLIQVDLVADSRKAGVMYDQSDINLFIERWAPKYGVGWDTTTLRGFNIDVEIAYTSELCSNNTIVYNNPEFRDIVLTKGWRPDGQAEYI